MILITTGTVQFPLTRLIDFTLDYYQSKTDSPVVVQTSTTITAPVPNHITIKKIVSNDEMMRLYRTADKIIAAAGEGTVLQLLQFAKVKPILFPRDPQYGEHVDNQQLLIAAALEKRGWANVARSTIDLQKLLSIRIEKNSCQGSLFFNHAQLVKELIAATESIAVVN